MSFRPSDRLLHQLLTSMGLSSLTLACGGRQTSGDEVADTGVTLDESDDQGDASEDGTESSSSAGESSTTMPSTETGNPDPACTFHFVGSGTLDPYQDTCMLPLTGAFDCANVFYLACADAIDGQTCETQCPGGTCAECQDHAMFTSAIGLCGPYLVDGKCCGLIGLEDDCLNNSTEGRPFVVEGLARRADVEALAPSSSASHLPEPLRRRLAEHWSRVAAAEHASIASFAQFALRLLALGVPPELIRDGFAAAGDEVRHAEAALALASRHAGQPLRFGPLDVRGAGESREDLESLVLACVREGCIDETLAALELTHAAESCDDPELADLLRRIADDEARHAGLAWRFVQWALVRDPSLRPKVAATFASLRPAAREVESLDHDARRRLRAHGCLPAEDRNRIAREGLRTLLRPCATALLSSTV